MINGTVKDKTAFDTTYNGYRFVATYLTEPKCEALIEIYKGADLIKEFLFPSYKIWNIAAHIKDIVDDIEHGLKHACIVHPTQYPCGWE